MLIRAYIRGNCFELFLVDFAIDANPSMAVYITFGASKPKALQFCHHLGGTTRFPYIK